MSIMFEGGILIVCGFHVMRGKYYIGEYYFSPRPELILKDILQGCILVVAGDKYNRLRLNISTHFSLKTLKLGTQERHFILELGKCSYQS